MEEIEIQDIEDKLLQVINNLQRFAVVASLVRDGANPGIFPAAYVYFAGDGEGETRSRPIDTVEFHVQVRAQNLASEAQLARDAYSLINAVRKAIRGKTLGIVAIEPFRCIARELSDYDEDESSIEYTCKFTTRQYQEIVNP